MRMESEEPLRESMKAECGIHADEVPAVIKDRLIRFYTSIGYQQRGDEADTLTFRRGSILKGLISFSPKSWKTVVEARVTLALEGQSNVLVNYKVNTTGQTITQGEVDFWNAEFSALNEAVITGFFQPANSRKAEQAAVRDNWRFLGNTLVALPFVLLAMIPAMLTAYLVIKPLSHSLLKLLPIVGAFGLSLVSAVLLVVTFAGLLLFPLPQLSGQLANWVRNRLPVRMAKPLLFAIIAASWGLLFGFIMTTFGMIKALKTDKQFIVLGGVIAGILVIGLIHDQREKKAKRPDVDHGV